MQIIYSELLAVPASTESGTSDTYNNFYDPKLRMDYGSGNDVNVVTNAFEAEGGDCSVYDNEEQTEYIPCAHFAMDIWGFDTWNTIVETGSGEPMKRECRIIWFCPHL